MISRFLASLASKKFLILTGLSGSGKTKLALAYAKWLTPGKDNYKLVAVGADWINNENLLGYPNGLIANPADPGSYISKAALDLMLRARNDPDQPYFLILDEMNLSHVERYFADFLSAIESGEEIHLHSDDERNTGKSSSSGGEEEGDKDEGERVSGNQIPGKVKLPDNLFVIGTVNVR